MNTNDSQSKRLIFNDQPIALWLFGGLWSAFSVWILIQDFQIPSLLFLLIGVGILLLSKELRVTLDQGAGELQMEYRGLFGRSVRTIPLAEIADVMIERSRSSRGGTTYRVTLLLHSGERRPLRSYYSSGYAAKEKMANQIRAAIGLGDLPEPPNLLQSLSALFRGSTTAGTAPAPLIPAIARNAIAASKEGETRGVRWTVEILDNNSIRWFSNDLTARSGFVLLLQTKPGMQLGKAGPMNTLARIAWQQVLRMYGLGEEELAGLEGASTVQGVDERLTRHYQTLTSSPFEARQTLNAWVNQTLIQWGERHPGGDVLMLLSGRGLFLCQRGGESAIAELSELGVDLVRSLGGGKNLYESQPPQQDASF